jgi:beta-glucosidase
VLEFTIKNTGSVAGKEVAQLYVRKPESEIKRPFKELKGFVKVDLRANEQKRVKTRISRNDLRYFDDERMKWRFEPGVYEIRVGSSSKDIRLKTEVTINK